MWTKIFTILLPIFFISQSKASGQTKRGIYSYTTNYGSGKANSWSTSSVNIPLQSYGSSGIDTFLPFSESNQVSIDLGSKENLLPVPVLSTNSIEKPVQEQPQEYAQPQTAGPAVIPYTPPPAVPVGAAAANVPINTGAVFLGSGSLGVISLGGGAYALGSGGIGYSGIRRQPRPSGLSPLYPPLQATPNLVPAATPSQSQSPQPPSFSAQQFGQAWQYDPFAQHGVLDPNQYASPGNTGFGEETFRIRDLKTTPSYATATIEQVQQQVIQPGQQAMSGFGEPIPQYVDLSPSLASQQISSQQIRVGTAQQQAEQQAQLRQQVQLQQQIQQQSQLQQQAQQRQQAQLQHQSRSLHQSY